uniref:Uncharacterized protein n=1 Tax=Rhizophora mucronata TaxID=61149 RepID=A0A2P2PRG0_RHIMU
MHTASFYYTVFMDEYQSSSLIWILLINHISTQILAKKYFVSNLKFIYNI